MGILFNAHIVQLAPCSLDLCMLDLPLLKHVIHINRRERARSASEQLVFIFDPVGSTQTLPRGMDQSSPTFQGVIGHMADQRFLIKFFGEIHMQDFQLLHVLDSFFRGLTTPPFAVAGAARFARFAANLTGQSWGSPNRNREVERQVERQVESQVDGFCSK